MKISRSYLKQIIKEELEKEAMNVGVSGAAKEKQKVMGFEKYKLIASLMSIIKAAGSGLPGDTLMEMTNFKRDIITAKENDDAILERLVGFANLANYTDQTIEDIQKYLQY